MYTEVVLAELEQVESKTRVRPLDKLGLNVFGKLRVGTTERLRVAAGCWHLYLTRSNQVFKC